MFFVKENRPYLIGPITKTKPAKGIITFIIGLAAGFALNSICVMVARANGNITITHASNVNIGLFIFAAVAVFIQATTEELQSRGMAFEMMSEVAPTWLSAVLSGIFFACLHLVNNGITVVSFLSITAVGICYSIIYYFTGSIWLPAGMHMAWNFTQDFIYGLPDSGNPSGMSIMNSTAVSGGWAYSTDFGVEGGYMAIIVHVALALIVLAVGILLKKRKSAASL